MNVLVTGAHGFIGRHLVEQLLRLDGVELVVRLSRSARPPHHSPRVVEARCDLNNQPQTALVVDYFAPDVIFHLAGDPVVRRRPEDPLAQTRENALATHSLLDCAPEGCRFVLASTTEVYCHKFGQEAREDWPPAPLSAYGASKAAAELLLTAFTRQERVEGVTVRLGATVGGGATRGLLPDLLRKLKGDSPTLELLGAEPGSRKPYTHVSDSANALLHLGLAAPAGVYNATTSASLSVADVAAIAMAETGRTKPVVWREDGNWVGDNAWVALSSAKAHAWGWAPRHSGHEAVKTAIKEMT